MQLNSKFKIQNSGDEIPNSNFKIPAHILGLATLVFFFLPLLVNAATLRTPPNNLGLVGYWSFEDGSGTTATDFSGNGNDGTLIGSMTDSDWVSGTRGTALEFDGTDDGVDTVDFDIGSTFTYATWVYARSGANNTRIMEKWNGSGNEAMRITAYTDGPDSMGGSEVDINFRVTRSDETRFSWTVGDQFPQNTWAHVTLTWDGSTVRGYVNGEEVTSGGLSGTLKDTNSTLSIGYSPHEARYFDGRIDDPRMYNRTLSATEVKDLYQSGFVRRNTSRKLDDISGLVGWWTLDGKDIDWSTQTASDASGNGNDGTITNMSTTTSPAFGQIGQALEFDGSDDYVNIGNDASVRLADGESMSWSFWVKSPGDNSRRVIHYDDNDNHDGDNPGTRDFYIIWYSNDETVTFWWGPSDAKGTLSSNAALTDSEWNHVTVVRDVPSDESRIYINGTLEGSTTDPTTGTWETTGQYAMIGGYENLSPAYFDGQVDDMRIYNRALSTDEVKRIYDATRPSTANASRNNRLTDGLVGMWSFDGADIDWSTQTASDASGNGNDGTITNMSTTTSPAFGQIGQALEFDGSDDRVDLSGFDFTTIANANEFTFGGWVKIEGDITTTDFAIGGNDGSGEDNSSFVLYSDAGGGGDGWRAGVAQDNYAGTAVLTSTSRDTTVQGEWQHVMMTWDGSTLSVYVDGEFDTSASTALTIQDIDATAIGTQGTGDTKWMEGVIDNVRMYDRVLSADEIRQLYRLGK